METRKNDIQCDYSDEMQGAFYAEDLENRFELAAAFPNLACWITDL